jgi:MFS family permease
MSATAVEAQAAGSQTPSEPSRPASRNSAVNDLEKNEKGDQSPDTASQASKEEPVRTVHGLHWFLVCASIYAAAFLYGLDTTIAADVQSAVVETYGQVQQLSWLGVGFLLGSVATILPIGNLFERFDIKWNFLAGILLFEVGSAICGAAPTIDALIIGRVIAGIGGSAIYLGALSYFSTLTTPNERGTYIAATGLFWGLGSVLGPVIGGAFSPSAATWRWGFYINLAVAAIFAPVYLTMPGFEPMPGATRMERVRSLDWLGMVLNAGVWATFTILFTFAGNRWAWNDGAVIALFVVFGTLLLAFILQQAFAIGTTKHNRLFPAHLLASRSQVLLAIATAAATAVMFVPVYFIPVYFVFVHGDSAIQAAIRLLPFLVVSMGVNLTVGTIVPKLPNYAMLYLVSGIFVVAGSAPLYLWTPETPMAQVYGFSILVAFGAGLVIQVGYTLASMKAVKQNTPEDVPHTISLQNVAQIGGGAISLIIAGQVFQSTAVKELTKVLAALNLSQEEIQATVAGTQSTVFERLDAETAAKAIDAITRAMGDVWILVIAAGAVLAVESLVMRWEKLF